MPRAPQHGLDGAPILAPLGDLLAGWKPRGERIEYAADPRHAEVLVSQQGLDTKSKGVVTPGEKVSVTEELLMAMEEGDQAAYRSQAMRLGYMSMDRPDVQFAAKELARGLSRPQ